jgi:excisionase family DNA binding protein
MSNDGPIELLTLDVAARECFVSRRTLEREIAAGRLRVTKIRRATRITRKELERYKSAMDRAA